MQLGLALTTLEGGLQGRTPTFQDLSEAAQDAERMGFDSLWMGDHLLYRFAGEDERGIWEVFSLLSALAATTTRIRLGSLVACTAFRSPTLLAKIAETIDEISGGRLILGVGAGGHEPEFAAFGYPFDHRVSRFEEALQVLVPLLRQGRVDFHGRYYQIDDCVLRPRGPSRSGPPLWIAAVGPRMLHLAARYADAWTTAWHTDPTVVQARAQALQAACRSIGRDPTSIAVTAGVRVRLPSPDADASAEASDEAISGSPEAIASRLQGFADLGVEHLIIALEPKNRTAIEELARIIAALHHG